MEEQKMPAENRLEKRSNNKAFPLGVLIYLSLIFMLFPANSMASMVFSYEGLQFFPLEDASGTVSSHYNQIVIVNKLEKFNIMLPLNLVPGYQWMLDTASINTEVLSELGAIETSFDDMGIPDINHTEELYIQWTFSANESGICNLVFNYKNLSDNDIYMVSIVAVAVLPDPDEKPAAFSLIVQPNKMNDVFTGQRCVFLVKVVNEGTGFGKDEPVKISVLNFDGGFDTIVNAEPNLIFPGEICEVSIVPGRPVDNNFDDPNNNGREGRLKEDEPNDNEPNDIFEIRECVVSITAERNGIIREQMVRFDVYPEEDLLGDLPASYRDRFIPYLEMNYPELGITSETVWKGTIVRPRILVVSHYLFFSEQWEMGLSWHVMIPPYDFAEIYLRRRDSDLSSTYAFKINSLVSGEDPYPVDLPSDGIWR
jgi:predicted secreted protein